MNFRILSAKPLVEKMRQDLIDRVNLLKSKGLSPRMSVVLVGDDPASLTYIRNKKKACELVGAEFELHQWSESISPEEFLANVEALNKNPDIHGIIIQLPVPDQLKHLDLTNLVDPCKDIDGFHGMNTHLLFRGCRELKNLLPCTPKGIVRLLQHYGIEIEGKEVLVIGRSLIVGKPLSMLLSNYDATVTVAHSKTKDLTAYTRTADIVVSAVGQANLLTANHFDPYKQTTVIDVGINILNGKLVGDVNFEEVSPLVKNISPVPGGVGPMTVISLIENLVIACEKKIKG
ncbi:MAG: bifunctional 5,10-methylenetetrahydrofolate dehydrogenase/5,10-methenyltetrahydrofolate cyclohydrolase [Candidatus Caldatribacteriota bacterium]